MIWFVLYLFSCDSASIRSLTVFTSRSSKTVKTFRNVSLGLEYSSDGFQCDKNGKKVTRKLTDMSYMPNRGAQKSATAPNLAFVLALGGLDGNSGGTLNGLMSVWDSDYMLHLIRGKVTSIPDYLDRILLGNMGAYSAHCIDIKTMSTNFGTSTCGATQSNWLDLDEGYNVYFVPMSKNAGKPFLIFAGVRTYPAPMWVTSQGKDEEFLYKHFRPPLTKHKNSYAYIKMTNWYAYHMLSLKLLDFFDYAGKIDNDIRFLKPFPEGDLPGMMARRELKMMCQLSRDPIEIAYGITKCMDTFLTNETQRCTLLSSSRDSIKLRPGAWNESYYWAQDSTATCYSNFMVFWLGLYASPEVRALAKHYNDWHPLGMWDYRWTDQQWWHRPLSMFGDGDLEKDLFHYHEIDVGLETILAHKHKPRFEMRHELSFFDFDHGSNRSVRDNLPLAMDKLKGHLVVVNNETSGLLHYYFPGRDGQSLHPVPEGHPCFAFVKDFDRNRRSVSGGGVLVVSHARVTSLSLRVELAPVSAFCVDGALLRLASQRSVYIVCAGKHYEFQSGAQFMRLGNSFESVLTVHEGEFNLLRSGGAFPDSKLDGRGSSPQCFRSVQS